MTFHTVLSRYQVETASAQFQSPHRNKAEDIYQKYVRENVPCEFYKEGILEKQHKPHQS
jgi:hypothetical protein|tara:strand:+ start:1103 stop:1279 length:177 start_codon:yes stop_codon:yes gene_type:complete